MIYIVGYKFSYSNIHSQLTHFGPFGPDWVWIHPIRPFPGGSLKVTLEQHAAVYVYFLFMHMTSSYHSKADKNSSVILSNENCKKRLRHLHK